MLRSEGQVPDDLQTLALRALAVQVTDAVVSWLRFDWG